MKTTQKTLLGLVLISPLLFSNFVMAEVSWVDLDADSTEYKWAYTTGDQDGIHFPITPASLRAPAGYLIIRRGE
jgi:hypothetical protein